MEAKVKIFFLIKAKQPALLCSAGCLVFYFYKLFSFHHKSHGAVTLWGLHVAEVNTAV